MFNNIYKKFEQLLNELDQSKIFLASVFILHSIGGRYIEKQVSEGIKQLLKNPWAKGILIFCATFTITKKTRISLVTAGIGFIIFRVFLQDDSYFCIVPKVVEQGEE